MPYGEAVTYRPLAAVLAIGDDTGEVTVSAVRGALEELALGQPVVLVIDDLHWAEPRLLDVLEDVASTSEGAPILLVCTARSELLEARGSWGAGNPQAVSLVLESLTDAESERLIDNLLGESDLPDSVRDYIVETSDGNPLFVEELLAVLVDRDILQQHEGRWTTAQVPAIPLPATIQALVSSRIDRLPGEERIALELASVEGRVFSPTTLSVLAQDQLRGDLDPLLAALVRKELLRRQPAGDLRYTFRHQLVRDAAYESMPFQTRVELHERLADHLAATADEPGEVVSYHRSRARTYREALGIV